MLLGEFEGFALILEGEGAVPQVGPGQVTDADDPYLRREPVVRLGGPDDVRAVHYIEGAGLPLLIVIADECLDLQDPIHPVHLTLHKVEGSRDAND